MRTFCCVCGMEKVNGVWGPKNVDKKLQPEGSSNGYCPECFDKAKKQIGGKNE